MTKNTHKKQTLFRSFKYASEGIYSLLLKERNFRIHLAVSVVALACCFFFQVDKYEWIAVVLLIAVVLSMEAINTSIEYLCDIVSPEYHPVVKTIKDIAAAAVFMSAIISVIVGCMIFVPYFYYLCRDFILK